MLSSYPLVWNDRRRPTPTWVPDTYGDYWKNGPRKCCTVCTIAGVEGHPPVPPWYTNAIYNPKTKVTYWQHFVKVSGLQDMVQRRQAFLNGFAGVRGTFWCGNCFIHACFLSLGEALGYPDVYQFYQLPVTQNMHGFACWLWLARFAGSVTVQTVMTEAQRKGVDVERFLIVQQSVLPSVFAN